MLRITLEAARVNAGYTQKEVAKTLKVSNKTVGNWENGVSTPSVIQANRLCSLYGIPYDNIIFFENQSDLCGLDNDRNGATP